MLNTRFVFVRSIILAFAVLSAGACDWIRPPVPDVAPLIEKIVPPRGDPGDLVKIYGRRFSNPVRDSQAVLYFGGIPVQINENADSSDIKFWSAVEIRFTVPVTARAGLNKVYIVTRDGESNRVDFQVGGESGAGVPQNVVGWVLHDEVPQAMVFKAKATKDQDGKWMLNTQSYGARPDARFVEVKNFDNEGYEVRLRAVRVDAGHKTSWVSMSAYELSGPTAEHSVQPFVNDYLTRTTGTEVGIGPDVLTNEPGWGTLWALGTVDQTITGVDSMGKNFGAPLWRIFLHDLDPFLDVLNLIRIQPGILMIGNDSGNGDGLLAMIAGDDAALTPDLFEIRFPGYRFSGVADLSPNGSELFVVAVTQSETGDSRQEILRLNLNTYGAALSRAITAVTSAPAVDLAVPITTALQATLVLGSGEQAAAIRAIPEAMGTDFDLWLAIKDTNNQKDYVASVMASAMADGVTDLPLLLRPRSVGITDPVAGDSFFVTLDPAMPLTAVVTWGSSISAPSQVINFSVELTDGAAGVLASFPPMSFVITDTSGGTFFGNPTYGDLVAAGTKTSFDWTSATMLTDATFDISFDNAMVTKTSDTFVVASVVRDTVLDAVRFDVTGGSTPLVRDPRDIYWIKKTPFVLISSHDTNEVAVFQSWGRPFYDHSFGTYSTGPTALYCGQEDMAFDNP